ncbi:hypothetical protein HOE425_332050 [Hoeflea sp. EC-HK425]|nr:hypothetical protein HOE425_332050 [Hoeflea sp. EC-HK425]
MPVHAIATGQAARGVDQHGLKRGPSGYARETDTGGTFLKKPVDATLTGGQLGRQAPCAAGPLHGHAAFGRGKRVQGSHRRPLIVSSTII